MHQFLSPEAKAELEAKRIAEEELEKEEAIAQKEIDDEKSKINVLILWRGGGDHDAPELTDSIILASFHRNKNHISLLSIPRDLYVEYWDYNSSWTAYKWKINGLYVHYLAKYWNEEEAVFELKQKITEITNEKIDYFVNIDFTWFKALVDSLWWVQIEVPKTIVDYDYPDWNLGYQTFILRKWDWLLDWEVALKYVRSRKNTGWDFWRSERQQQVIESLKAKILTWKYLTSPSNIKDLYNIFTSYVTTDVSAFTAAKIFADIKSKKDTAVYSSGINDTCIETLFCEKWWLLYYPQRVFFWGQSVLLPDWADSSELNYFDTIQEYSDIVFNHPSFYSEDYKISIFSKIWVQDEAKQLVKKIKILWWEISMEEKIWSIPEKKSIIIEEPKEITSLTWSNTNSPKLNLEQYNNQKLKEKNNVQYSSEVSEEITNDISAEAENIKTKIIINWISPESETLVVLKQILWLESVDVELYEGWGPKYWRDPNTKIEIIFTPTESIEIND